LSEGRLTAKSGEFGVCLFRQTTREARMAYTYKSVGAHTEKAVL